MSFSPTTVICAEVLLLVSGPYLVFIFFLWTCFWFIPLKFHRLVSSHISPKLFFACHIYSLSLISVYLVNAALLFPNLSALSLLFMCLCDGFFFFLQVLSEKEKNWIWVPSEKQTYIEAVTFPENLWEQWYFFTYHCCSQNQETISELINVWA